MSFVFSYVKLNFVLFLASRIARSLFRDKLLYTTILTGVQSGCGARIVNRWFYCTVRAYFSVFSSKIASTKSSLATDAH